jgi:hypothetical protein
MKISYGVIWHEDGRELAGRLEVGARALRLYPHGLSGTPLRELPFAGVTSFELVEPRGREWPALEIAAAAGRRVCIEGAAARWISRDLAAREIAPVEHELHAGLGF